MNCFSPPLGYFMGIRATLHFLCLFSGVSCFNLNFWPSCLEKKFFFPSFETIMKRLAPLSFYKSQHRAFNYEYRALCTEGRYGERVAPQGTLWIGKAQPVGDSVFLISVASIYLVFKLPQRRSRYSFQPPAPFGSKFDFCVLSGSSAWNRRDLTSDTCLQFLCFCSLIITVFLPISTLTLKLNS